MQDELLKVAEQFQIKGELVDAQLFGSGHINASFLVTYDQSGEKSRYLFQKINHEIFKQPAQVMDNILRVTNHLRSQLTGLKADEASRRTMTVIPTHKDQTFCRDSGGGYWRAYLFIENAQTFDAVQTPEQAYAAAYAFGEFQRQLVDLPGPRLHESIPDFHNTPLRYKNFRISLMADTAGRAKDCQPEVEYALANKELADALFDLQQAGELPERIIHNDTKFNNVLFDDETGEGICVIDLDTVMPGLIHFDFGDMVRTATSPAEEDEGDLDKVTMQLPMFKALVRGYLSAADEFLTDAEKTHLPLSGKVIIYEQGLRFLADHLAGDVYYPTYYDGHNLVRSRTQFKLLQSLIEQESEIEEFMENVLHSDECSGAAANR